MRLLTPQEVKKTKSEEETRTQQKAVELSDQANKMIVQFNRLKVEIAEKESVVKSDHEKFVQDMDQKKLVIQDEISSLEHQRDIVLKPLEIKEKKLKELESSVSQREASVSEREGAVLRKEHSVGKLSELYENKLDDLADREDKVAKREESVLFHETAFKNLESRQNKIYEDQSNLLNKKALELQTRENAIKQESLRVEKLRTETDERNRRLDEKEKLISSRQSALRLAIEESKQKGIWQNQTKTENT